MSSFDEALKKTVQPDDNSTEQSYPILGETYPRSNSWGLYAVIYHTLGVAVYSLYLLGSGYMDKHSAIIGD